MKRLQAFLKALRIFDADNTLSLTSLMMLVLVAKVAISPALDWSVVSALFLGLANYNGKKWFAKSRATKEVSDAARLDKLEQEQRGLIQASNLKGMGRS